MMQFYAFDLSHQSPDDSKPRLVSFAVTKSLLILELFSFSLPSLWVSLSCFFLSLPLPPRHACLFFLVYIKTTHSAVYFFAVSLLFLSNFHSLRPFIINPLLSNLVSCSSALKYVIIYTFHFSLVVKIITDSLTTEWCMSLWQHAARVVFLFCLFGQLYCIYLKYLLLWD